MAYRLKHRVPIDHNKLFVMGPQNSFGPPEDFIRMTNDSNVRTQADEIVLRLVGVIPLPCHLYLYQSRISQRDLLKSGSKEAWKPLDKVR